MKSNSNFTTTLSSILWALFLMGLMEIMAFFIHSEDLLNFFIIATFLGLTVIITAFKTFQPQVGYYHELTPYFVHPLFLFIGLTSFLFLNTDLHLQQTAIIFSLIAYLILFSENFSDLTHKAHDGVKFLIIFFLYDVVFESIHLLSLQIYIVPLFITLITLFFFLHMFWRLKAFDDKDLTLGLLFSLIIGGISFLLVSHYLYASFLILSILLLVVYYVFWGILHHTIQRNLTLSLFLEYLLLAGIVFSMFIQLITGW